MARALAAGPRPQRREQVGGAVRCHEPVAGERAEHVRAVDRQRTREQPVLPLRQALLQLGRPGPRRDDLKCEWRDPLRAGDLHLIRCIDTRGGVRQRQTRGLERLRRARAHYPERDEVARAIRDPGQAGRDGAGEQGQRRVASLERHRQTDRRSAALRLHAQRLVRGD